jgi:alcohol dehydrogenase class IV
MGFLVEVVNSFGREKKKLCMSENAILLQANDEMIPLFQKVIEKVEFLKKEAESKKLMELGHRIAHLQKMVEGARKQVTSQDSPLRAL